MMIETTYAGIGEEKLQTYAEAIWHFRGYLDKEKFEDDLEFPIEFVKKVSLGDLPEENVGK